MKDLCNKSNEDIIKYLKSVDFVCEAQEFRKASIDGLVSFPVGCFYRSCKGGSNKIKIYDCKTEEMLQACKNCILSSSKCVVTCSICDEESDICEECSSVGYESTETLRRKCRLCQLDGIPCLHMHEISWVSDSEAAQRAHMSSLQEHNQKVPIPDPLHVLKLVRSSLFNYWTFVGEYLISLKLLRGSDCKYRESADKLRKSKILITCQKNTFGELSSKILLIPSGILLFSGDSEKRFA